MRVEWRDSRLHTGGTSMSANRGRRTRRAGPSGRLRAAVLICAALSVAGKLAAQSEPAADIVGRAADRLVAYTDQPADEHRWEHFVPPEARPHSRKERS